MVAIQTERLSLRALTLEDAEKMVRLNSDPEVQRFLGESPRTLDAIVSWIESVNARYPAGSTRGYWAAEYEREFIGWFHLRPSRDTGLTELGYRLAVTAWGRGLATEGSRALLALAAGEGK